MESKGKGEYIDFEYLQKTLGLSDTSLFLTYLKEVYNDLSEKVNEKKRKGINIVTFYDYLKIPIFISEKLFAALDKDGDAHLNSHEFIDGFQDLFMGDFDSTLDIIFNMLDFDRDGLIKKDDCKIMLSYLPLKDDNSTTEYKYQMKSLEEIDEILKETFESKKQLNRAEFENAIQKKRSDIYLQILCFLYFKKPFNSKNIENFKASKKRIVPKAKKSTPNVNAVLNTPSTKLLLSPTKKSTLGPLDSMIKSKELRKLMNPFEDEKSPDTPLISGLNGMIRMNNEKVVSTNLDENADLDTVMKNSKNLYDSPSNFLKKSSKKSKNDLDLDLGSKLIEMNNFNLNDSDDDDDEEEESKTPQNRPRVSFQKGRAESPSKKDIPKGILKGKSSKEANSIKNSIGSPIKEKEKEKEKKEGGKILYEDWIYKISGPTDKIFKYFLTVIDQDIFYYKSEKKESLLGMHNLTGCYIKEADKKKVGDTTYYAFQIFFPNKERNYYTPKKETADNFVTALKKGIGYQNFFDHYEMLEDIGEGKFGFVKLGVHKATRQRVAIKIIKKEKMKENDNELVRSEIDIMKLCHHPNVVRLLDHFENVEYIFIVMEYISGGSLREYFEKNKYNFTEKRCAEVMFQIGMGIDYLHKYGIVHRDLKPDNIMMTSKENMSQIKIMDFGLSKIMSPTEAAADGFGTLIFVAPEVLIRKPYNKQIDIWSMGVILYYMLTGILPFDDDSDVEEVIAKKIVFKQAKFPSEYFSKRSEDVVDLIKRCLIKEPDQRIKIKDFLNHKWFKSFNLNASKILAEES